MIPRHFGKMYASLPACRNESLAGMQVAELSHDSFTMRMRTDLTPARKLRKGKSPGEFSGAFDLVGFGRSLVSVIAGLECLARGHGRHLIGDMTDTFAGRQVDGSDLVSGEENTVFCII